MPDCRAEQERLRRAKERYEKAYKALKDADSALNNVPREALTAAGKVWGCIARSYPNPMKMISCLKQLKDLADLERRMGRVAADTRRLLGEVKNASNEVESAGRALIECQKRLDRPRRPRRPVPSSNTWRGIISFDYTEHYSGRTSEGSHYVHDYEEKQTWEIISGPVDPIEVGIGKHTASWRTRVTGRGEITGRLVPPQQSAISADVTEASAVFVELGPGDTYHIKNAMPKTVPLGATWTIDEMTVDGPTRVRIPARTGHEDIKEEPMDLSERTGSNNPTLLIGTLSRPATWRGKAVLLRADLPRPRAKVTWTWKLMR